MMRSIIVFTGLLICCQCQAQTEILILGSDHLQNVYKEGNVNTDVLTNPNQQSIKAFLTFVPKYKPDQVMVEVLPERQAYIDSIYGLYQKDQLQFTDKDELRSEVIQLAFRIGKSQNIPAINCVNAPGGTSQSVLDNGTNIDLYKNETTELRKVVGKVYSELGSGKISFQQFLEFLNSPEAYQLIYHLRYITPARVTNGRFTKPDTMIDTAFINEKYIGAELISVFKNRDLKIYSNIVTAQMKTKAKRILLVIGVAHIGSLRSIFRDDPAFRLVELKEYQ